MYQVDQPRETAAELRDAVDQGRVADEADTGYALMLAAEFSERAGDLAAAEVLAGRAVEVNRLQGDTDCYPRAFRAELLLRLGREDEAMAELAVLRPSLSEDPDAVSYVTDMLAEGGRAEIAEQWLTEALRTALPRQQESGDERATRVVWMLARHRHRLRSTLDLPHDDLDQLAERMMSVVRDVHAEDELDDEPSALLFWPPLEFDRLLLRWPAMTEAWGPTWENYRAMLEQLLVLASESGVAPLGLVTASVDELVTYADCGDCDGGDPPDPQVFQDYARHLAEHAQEIAWPPGRNDACWCGSSEKYKKCCLPRSRT